jgi:hypothetical protein
VEVELTASGFQSRTIEVPRGVEVRFLVRSPAGWGLEGVQLEATAVDTTAFRRYQAVTDRAGNAVFPHLGVGQYHVDIHKPGFVRESKRVTVTDEQRESIGNEVTLRFGG